jgi:hypothetical protein
MGFKSIAVNNKIHRLINSRWPPIGLFDELADSEQALRLLFNLEMFTNPRLNASIGRLARIPEGGIVTGVTVNQIMAAFVHCHDEGGRFNDGKLGACPRTDCSAAENPNWPFSARFFVI